MAKKSDYPQLESGPWGADWLDVPRGHTATIACCDCSLVHEIRIRKRGTKYQLQFRRDSRATAALRRKK